jgi:hypothetical protein
VIKTAFLTLGATTAGIGIGFAGVDERNPPSGPDHADAMGFSVAPHDLPVQRGRDDFDREAFEIYERHWAQTRDTVAALRRRFEQPVLGEVDLWDAMQKLAFCVDRSDTTLYCASQLTHVKQILAAMEASGVDDPDMIVAAVTHDLGKILLLEGEAPENVVCSNRPIGYYPEHVGLDNVTFQWNHDEFMYSRLKDHVAPHVAWLVRYHSIDFQVSAPLMNRRDIAWAEKYLAPFRRFDVDSKSAFSLPPRAILDRYRSVIERAFPRPIAI